MTAKFPAMAKDTEIQSGGVKLVLLAKISGFFLPY
jgi:hypothetical protein